MICAFDTICSSPSFVCSVVDLRNHSVDGISLFVVVYDFYFMQHLNILQSAAAAAATGSIVTAA
jgi:hypothetical protein